MLYNEWEEVDESWQQPVTALAKVKLFRQMWPEATPELEGADTKSIPGLECAETRENDCVTI